MGCDLNGFYCGIASFRWKLRQEWRMDGKETAHAFMKFVVRLYGVPINIVSNCRVQFTLKICKELCRALEFKRTIHKQKDKS